MSDSESDWQRRQQHDSNHIAVSPSAFFVVVLWWCFGGVLVLDVEVCWWCAGVAVWRCGGVVVVWW